MIDIIVVVQERLTLSAATQEATFWPSQTSEGFSLPQTVTERMLWADVSAFSIAMPAVTQERMLP